MTLGLRQLRYFLAIADAGALSRAAESLNVAQSALSHHVAEIERTLGVKLFDRKARGVSLTAAGHRLHEHASAILSALSKAEQDVRTFTDAVSGPVSLGLSHTAIAVIALDVMQAVRKHCPGVHLTLSEGLSPTLIGRVLSGSIDLALAYNPPKDTRLATQALLDEDLYLVGHPGPDRKIVEPDPVLEDPARQRARPQSGSGVARDHPGANPAQPDRAQSDAGDRQPDRVAAGARGRPRMRDPRPLDRACRAGTKAIPRATDRAADAGPYALRSYRSPTGRKRGPSSRFATPSSTSFGPRPVRSWPTIQKGRRGR